MGVRVDRYGFLLALLQFTRCCSLPILAQNISFMLEPKTTILTATEATDKNL